MNHDLASSSQVVNRSSLGVPFSIPLGYHRNLIIIPIGCHRDLIIITSSYVDRILPLPHPHPHHQNKFERLRGADILRLAGFHLPTSNA